MKNIVKYLSVALIAVTFGGVSLNAAQSSEDIDDLLSRLENESLDEVAKYDPITPLEEKITELRARITELEKQISELTEHSDVLQGQLNITMETLKQLIQQATGQNPEDGVSIEALASQALRQLTSLQDKLKKTEEQRDKAIRILQQKMAEFKQEISKLNTATTTTRKRVESAIRD